jgi:hypothetical protein
MMIEQIKDLPDNVVGFSAKGVVTAGDYETVIIPAVEARLSKHQKMRFLYHVGEEFSRFDAAAIWEDTKIGLKHLASWERIAVVTDVEWVRVAVQMFSFLLHGRVRVFHNSEMDAARLWVSE